MAILFDKIFETEKLKPSYLYIILYIILKSINFQAC